MSEVSVGGQTATASVKDNSISHASCTKKKAKVKKKSKKQKDYEERESVTDASQQQSIIETANETMGDVIERERGEKKLSAQEQRKVLQSARANERRLMIERKRLEKELLERKRKEEEERQLALKQQLQDNNNTITENTEQCQEHSNTINDNEQPLPDWTIMNRLRTQALLDDDTAPDTDAENIELTESERKLREAIERTRELRQKNRLQEILVQQKEEVITTNPVMDSKGDARQRIITNDSSRSLQGKKELNYKLQLELLTNRQNQRTTQSNLFSYFSYLPKKSSNKDKKKSKSTSTKRR